MRKVFQKGNIPHNKGKNFPSPWLIGNKNVLGKHWKIKDTSKMSLAKKGKMPKNLETLHKLPRTEDWKKKISDGGRGKSKLHFGGESRSRRSLKQTSYNYSLKKLVFDHYGWICKCCGETCRTFLSVDHVNNDGNKDVNSSGKKVTGASLYKRVIDLDYPDQYQILCFNCNYGKSLNGGVCPHSIT